MTCSVLTVCEQYERGQWLVAVTE